MLYKKDLTKPSHPLPLFNVSIWVQLLRPASTEKAENMLDFLLRGHLPSMGGIAKIVV